MSRVAKFAWGLLAYNLLVIAWGAYVRASGSGAGCGAHWPLCNGEVLPRAPGVEMLVELSHRITSGLALVGGLALAIAAHRSQPRGSLVRRGAWTAFGFVCAEALIGAALVLFELVAHDKSMKRGLSMALHLTNTFFLLAALALTAFWASGGSRVSLRRQGALPWVFGVAIAGMLLLGASGAVTALGDTLFPVHTLSEGLAADLSHGAHLFVRLRVLHPVIATAVAALVLAASTFARILRPSPQVRSLARSVSMLVLAQMVAGVVNVTLLAPVPMQLVHLLLADAVWIALVLLTASALRAPDPSEAKNASLVAPTAVPS
ncbi:COX15/CtaA family protein [Pendulispora brunnea]|uniref:COX15/CtaA family protein n=1 Tax=Pendulispora brunnea TaxID=2905690 RepID=A0ABZ2K9B6_9BACT